MIIFHIREWGDGRKSVRLCRKKKKNGKNITRDYSRIQNSGKRGGEGGWLQPCTTTVRSRLTDRHGDVFPPSPLLFHNHGGVNRGGNQACPLLPRIEAAIDFQEDNRFADIPQWKKKKIILLVFCFVFCFAEIRFGLSPEDTC